MRRRLLPLTLLCAGTSLSHTALAANSCLLNGDPQLSFPGTSNPDVFGVTANLETTSGYELYLCSPTTLDISWLTSYAFGDFNHDGFEDLVFGRSSNSGGAALVFLNDKTGSGTVVLSATVPTGAGAAPTVLDVLDLDGNGWDDILTSNGSDGTFTVMLNSRGNFNVTQYAVASDVTLLAAADVNGDGFPDVITESATDQSVSVSLNKGDGTFAAPVTYHVGGSVATLTVGDLNGDGHPDIYVASAGVGGSGVIGPLPSNPGSQKLINNGDGTFTPSAWQPASSGSAGGSISISGGGVTVTSHSFTGLFGSASGATTPPVTVTSGTGQIKLPTLGKVTVVTKSGGTGTTAAGTGSTGGNTKSGAAASSGGGAMDLLSLALVGLLGIFRRKRAW